MRHCRTPSNRSTWVTLVLAVCVTFPTNLVAQVTTASILGTVRDETESVLPGVTMTITNLETGISRTVITDGQGRFVATQLALGDNYQVQAELSGFQTSIRRGIQLTLGREAVVDVTLRIGDVTEDIVVSSEAPLVESTNAMGAGHVSERQMRELPLNARSYIDLSLMQPGTIRARTAGNTSFGDTGTHLTVSGARPTATTFLLDGTMTTSVRGKAPASIAGTALGVDAIREFEVITSPYSAEYGRSTGGTINVASKAGTNRFHGSVFHFLRNDNLDARNFFDPVEGPPEFKRNQFGFSLGGPIVHNRTFFFGNYEGLRQRLGITNIFQVPTDEVRQGLLDGKTVAIKPEVEPYLALYPRANGRDFGDGTAEFSTVSSRPTDEDFFTFRIDQQLTDNHAFFVRYTLSDALDRIPGSLLMFLEDNTSRSQFGTAEHRSIFSSRLLNVARFGFTRHNLVSTEIPSVDIDSGLSLQPGTVIPRLAVSGLSEFGSSDLLPQGFLDSTFELYDSLTYTLGRQTFKAGGQIQYLQNDAVSNTRQSSRWNFPSVEDFLLGQANRVQIAPRDLADPERQMRQTFVAWFVQDDVRLTPRLTLNLGLRGEWASTINERDGELASLPLDLFGTGTFDDIRTGDSWYHNPGMAFGPRVGLAWDPFGDGKTAVRGGFGIFYDHIWSWWIKGTGSYRMGPFYNTFDLREDFPFPMTAQQFVALLRERQGREVPFGNQVYQPENNPKHQQVRQYSFDVQRQVATDTVIKVGYKGSRGIHLPRVTDFNTAVPESIVDGMPIFSADPQAPNPLFGTMLVMPTDSESFYNALLVELTKRFSRGVQFQLAYTLSKLIDEGSGVRTSGDAIAGAGAGTVLSHRFRTLDRALSTFDVRHNFVTNISVELPFGTGRPFPLEGIANAVLGGWAINSIVTLASGNPATIGQGTTAATSLLGGSRRPDLAAGANNNPRLGGPDQYFDPSQFVPADPRRFGTVGRNTLIGPGFATVDFSLIRSFHVPAVSDGFRVSLRAEVFNLLNRANFSLPDTEVFDGRGQPRGSAGRITQTASTARQIQFGLRLTW